MHAEAVYQRDSSGRQKSAIRFREKSRYSDKSFCLDGNFHFRAKISRSKRVTAQERKKEEKAAKVAK
jgi:hypothetical protein